MSLSLIVSGNIFAQPPSCQMNKETNGCISAGIQPGFDHVTGRNLANLKNLKWMRNLTSSSSHLSSFLECYYEK
jgi:hypothetical protein